ncbi:MAG: FAD-binding oxidoreductase [Kiritimatiellae bacterium]|nr:FAD-binding oxidoreductase [Kiritimatiellia bacterium]MDD5523080.1 FAD-binding oxidoreductase [Kiritimatiellia bacterium]
MAEVKIRINSDRELTVVPGNSLYATLTGAGVFVPSACGGRGGCGLCRMKILKGAESQPFTKPEKHWLSDEERVGSLRLSCQVKVLNDLQISIPEQLLKVKEYQSQVVSLRNLTYDIREVRLKLIKPEKMDFRPGQYIQFKIPAYELSRRPVFRTYSLANDPASNSEIELEVRYVPNGISTTYIHKYLKEGDEVTINGPYGDSFLRNDTTNVILIAGGSGMSPVKSMLLDMVAKNDRRKIRYFFGAKSLRDLFLVDLLREMEKKLADFRFIPALSEPLPEDNWPGETGLITEVVDRNLADVVDAEVYLCGSPLMIDACLKVLRGKKMPEDRIHYDKFG